MSSLFQHVCKHLQNSKYVCNNVKLLKYISRAMAIEHSCVKFSLYMRHTLELCLHWRCKTTGWNGSLSLLKSGRSLFSMPFISYFSHVPHGSGEKS